MNRVHYLGNSVVENFRFRLMKEIKLWSERWCVNLPEFNVDVKQADETRWFVSECKGTIWDVDSCYLVADFDEADMSTLIFGEELDQQFESNIKAGILEQCKKDLILRCFSKTKGSASIVENVEPNFFLVKRVIVRIGSEFGSFSFELDTKHLEAELVQRRQCEKGSLSPVKSALSATKVSLEVSMDFSTQKIGDLIGLAPGQVLVSGSAWSENIRFLVGGKHTFTGGLAAKDGKKTIVLDRGN